MMKKNQIPKYTRKKKQKADDFSVFKFVAITFFSCNRNNKNKKVVEGK